MLYNVILATVMAQVDYCNCYCCPSSTNPFGSQIQCSNSKPDFQGQFEITSSLSCTAIGCKVNYPVSCPMIPIVGPINTSGIVRWGCKSGCRFGPDGFTQVNDSTFDPGFLQGSNAFKTNLATVILNFLFFYVSWVDHGMSWSR